MQDFIECNAAGCFEFLDLLANEHHEYNVMAYMPLNLNLILGAFA